MLNLRQGYHNGGKPITVVPEFKKKKIYIYINTVRLHVTIKNNNEDGQTHYVKRYMTDR